MNHDFGSGEISSASAGIRWNSTSSLRIVAVPHRLLAMIIATIGLASWLRRRFTLRTLLIATTVVAVVLGLIVWAVR
jgi:hypothetical protein